MSAKSAIQTLRGQQPSGHKNSERDMQRLFDKQELSLPIPIHPTEHPSLTNDTQLCTTYHIDPQDWIKYWMDTCPKLLGGWNADAFTNFESFWKVYQVQHPGHKVFAQHSGNLHRVVPLLFHGDEGRAVKRSQYMVFSIESPLGSLEDKRLCPCSCSAEMAARSNLPSYGDDAGTISPEILETARKQTTNYKGHSYLSKWLLFGAGGWLYKKHPYIIDAILEKLSMQFESLFYDGVALTNGSIMYAAVINIKGDMDWHKKSMGLCRSYGNLGHDSMICHHCHAGANNFPFEDYREDPDWATTFYRDRPWSTDDPPALSRIPYDDAVPEKILAGDIFHIHKLGVGRDVVGGILVVLLRLGFFDHPGSTINIDDRFSRAHSMFALWCKASKKTPGLRSFSKAFFNMKSLVSAPWSNSKGSDTMLLLEWLQFTLKLQLQNPTVPGHDILLRQMVQVCDNCVLVKMVHHHKLWLERDCAKKLYIVLMTILKGYAVLGRQALRLRIRAFIQKPKHHALHHLAYELKHQLLQGHTLIASPQMTACEMNEDFMGRICRLSRRVGFRLVDLRVGQRYFLKVNALLKKRGDLKSKKPNQNRDGP